MWRTSSLSSRTPHTRQQTGVALYVVSVALTLAMLLVVWASKAALFLDVVTGNDADYQRAFEATQAMLEDAQYDIYLHLHGAGHSRPDSSMPHSAAQWTTWAQTMSQTAAPHCNQALCLRRVQGDNFWEYESALGDMLAAGARYGSYTARSSGNPLLTAYGANTGAWYWIEPMLLNSSLTAAPADPTVIFRITALAFGTRGYKSATGRSSTMAVVQSLVAYMPDAAQTSSLRTLSWRHLQ